MRGARKFDLTRAGEPGRKGDLNGFALPRENPGRGDGVLGVCGKSVSAGRTNAAGAGDEVGANALEDVVIVFGNPAVGVSGLGGRSSSSETSSCQACTFRAAFSRASADGKSTGLLRAVENPLDVVRSADADANVAASASVCGSRVIGMRADAV